MDPLSISASIIAVLQASNAIISVCYNFKAAMTKGPWSLIRVIDEVKDIRSILETLEKLSEEVEDSYGIDGKNEGKKRRPIFNLLCEPETGPLDSCLRELKFLEKKINGPSGNNSTGRITRTEIFKQVLKWHLNERDAQTSLERLQQCKNTLNLAITADEASLLLEIQRMTNALSTTVKDVGASVADLVGNLRRRESEEKQTQIMQWLAPFHASDNHAAARKPHQNGTSNWFINSEEFADFHSSAGVSLWLSGFPGTGKTILFSRIVDCLQTKLSVNHIQNPIGFAYFYCDFRRRDFQDPINILGSLAAQICDQFRSYPEALELEFEESCNNGAQKRRPELSQLKRIMEYHASNHRILLLVDALDECEKKKDILDFFLQLKGDKADINILLSSREDQDIAQRLHTFSPIRLESHTRDINLDIHHYVDVRLQTDARLRWLSTRVKCDITRSLDQKSGGMFRWAQCQLDNIASLRTVKAIRNALQELPQGLDETYKRILLGISKHDAELVRRILVWLAFAVMPVTLTEIYEVVAVEQDMEYLDEECRLNSPEDILSLCSSFISMVEPGFVRLAHLSVKDYLLSAEIREDSSISMFALSHEDTNLELASICLTYLFLPDFADGPCQSAEEYVERLHKLPFTKHAATGWAYYFRTTKQTAHLKSKVLEFFSPSSRAKFMSWVQVLNADYNFKWNLYPQHATSLYYAASFGLDHIVNALVENGAVLDAPGSRFGGTALHGAVLRCHVPAMKVLLEAGADPNRADFNNVTPLHTAVVGGDFQVIGLLLRFGASKDAIDGMGETPLVWAERAGQLESRDLLLGLAAEGDALKEKTTNPKLEVWKRTVPYFPDFYGRRSGLDSSIVISIEHGTKKEVFT